MVQKAKAKLIRKEVVVDSAVNNVVRESTRPQRNRRVPQKFKDEDEEDESENQNRISEAIGATAP